MLLNLKQLEIPPGDRLILTALKCQDYEQILEELGEHRSLLLSYSRGTLEIMTPLFIHENTKVLIGDFNLSFLLNPTRHITCITIISIFIKKFIPYFIICKRFNFVFYK